jgi:uncharacterized protein
MKNRIFAIFALMTVCTAIGYGQASDKSAAVQYDAELAKKLGGNDQGMKSYVLCILKTGPRDGEIRGKERDDLFKGHMATINRLADEGKLGIAGPFGKNDKAYRGLFILNAATIAEAEQLIMQDPTVKAGVFVYELTPWFGSASLMATPELHKKLVKPAEPKSKQ